MYSSGVRRFQLFVAEACASLALPPIPAASPADLRALLSEPWIVGSFVGALYMEGLGAGSARSYLSGLQHFASDLDGLAPTIHPAVQMVLRGFTSLGPSLTDKRPPITPLLLEALLLAIPSFPSPYEPALFRAIFSLAFYGCFRVSEYLKSKDEGKWLRLCDISVSSPDVLVVSLKKSKTMQRAHAIPVSLPSVPGVSCPVAAMRAFLAIRPSLASAAPLFYSRNLRGPVDAKQANCYLRGLLTFMGVSNALSFSSHSFRIGAASAAAAKPGASLAELQALGRWP